MGYNDIKTNSGVYFYVLRKSSYAIINSVIPYEIVQLNIGGGMNAATGIFTAPTSGRYFFSFTGLSGAAGTGVHLRLNQVFANDAYGSQFQNNMPLSATLNLNQGDQVDIFLGDAGSIFDNANLQTMFSGFLLEQDLSL